MSSTHFYIVYFGLLGIDLLLTYLLPEGKWRLILEPFMMVLLFLYFRQRYKSLSTNTPRLIQIGLSSLMLGGFFLMNSLPLNSFLAGFSFFLVANIAYTIMFYRYADMNLKRVFPFITVASIFAMVLLFYFHDSLGDYFLPASFYIFVMLNCIQAAFLRYKQVNRKSFLQVFFGTTIFFIAQVIAAIHYFLWPEPHLVLFMIFAFFTSQLLIIQGVLNNDLNPVNPAEDADKDAYKSLEKADQ